MNIEGMGPKTIKDLIRYDLISSPVDLYFLQDKKQRILDSGIIGPKNLEKIFAEIEKSKERSLEFLLVALGIPSVGKNIARTLAIKFLVIYNIIGASVDELTECDNISDTIANDILNFFKDVDVLNMLDVLENQCGMNMYYLLPDKTINKLNGQTFTITGSFKEFRREELEALVVNYGGKFSSAISKNTDWLIAGYAAGTKLRRARELNIPVISVDEFIVMCS